MVASNLIQASYETLERAELLKSRVFTKKPNCSIWNQLSQFYITKRNLWLISSSRNGPQNIISCQGPVSQVVKQILVISFILRNWWAVSHLKRRAVTRWPILWRYWTLGTYFKFSKAVLVRLTFMQKLMKPLWNRPLVVILERVTILSDLHCWNCHRLLQSLTWTTEVETDFNGSARSMI